MAPTEDVYTHGHQDAVLRSHRWRTAENSAAYLVPHLRAGNRLLDVGSGPGTLTADLARVVSPGEVIGIDVAESVVEEAAAHAVQTGVTNVSFQVGDFRQAGFESASFDVVHAHQVLQHLREPVAAMAAMAGLARPGGVVAIRESDYGAFTWAPDNDLLQHWRAIYDGVARRNGAEPNAGRMLLGWAHAAGLPNVTYTSSTWTFATPADRSWWAGLWAERCTSSSFAAQAVSYGITTGAELEVIAHAWRDWAGHPDAVFVVPHGELMARP
jgi:ubiquinone/menaquinone biosynthesis C-methylase UbiE